MATKTKELDTLTVYVADSPQPPSPDALTFSTSQDQVNALDLVQIKNIIKADDNKNNKSKPINIKGNDETAINHDGVYKKEEELIQLRKWRDTIGIPAQQQNEQLLIDIELLKQQSRSLTMELETYSHEVHKLENENKDLSEELEKHRDNILDESQSRQSLNEKTQELFELHRRCEAQQFEEVQNKEIIDELTDKNHDLQKENDQYKVIVDKLQKEEILLKEKMDEQSTKLAELQSKYSKVDEEYYTLESVAKHQLEKAQQLKSELSHLNRQHNTALDEINNTEEACYFGNIDKRKTIRYPPQTLRLTESDTLRWQESNNSLYNASKFHQQTTLVYDQSLAFPSEREEQIKEELQIEFDDKMGKEKGKLIDKHKLEMGELNGQIVEYKKKLMQQSTEFRQLQNRMSNVENGRVHQHIRHNPNNEQDMSKCKVFGWRMW